MSSEVREPSLQFLGASGTVTGSKFLLEAGGRRVLLDCGLFQGPRRLRERNWSPPPFDVQGLDAVVLSHAHLDHSGYLPVLARLGYRGPIYSTAGTRDLLGILLRDAARLAEEEAAYANRKGYSRHHPALPLFTLEDAEQALRLVKTQPYGAQWPAVPGISGRFHRAGHILGSAIVELDLASGQRLVHSGDLGRWNQPILRDPETVERCDILLLECTYGGRTHPPDPMEALAAVVNASVERGGALLIPSFAVGRAQNLIWILYQLQQQGRIPSVPIYIDSPMANRVSEVTCKHMEDLDQEMTAAMDAKDCPLCCRQYHLVETPEESKALNALKGALIVIAGSGMATGGRILHHLANRLPDPRTTVLFVGYQAESTLGRKLLEHPDEVHIYGMKVPVRAGIASIDGLSAHADQGEILRWLRGFVHPPRQTWLVHGEPGPARRLAAAIGEELDWNVAVAEDGQRVSLESEAG